MFCCVVYFMFWTWSSCITGPVCKVSSHNNVIGLLKTTYVYIIGLLKPTNYNGISLFKPTGLNKLFACNVTSFFIFSLSTLYRSFIFFIKFDFRQPWFSGRSSLTCVMRIAQLWHLMLKYFAWNNCCMKYISKRPKWFFFHILLLLLEFFCVFCLSDLSEREWHRSSSSILPTSSSMQHRSVPLTWFSDSILWDPRTPRGERQIIKNTLPLKLWPRSLFFFTKCSIGGIIRGAGIQKVGAICNLVGYYGIGLPIGASLMFAAKLGIEGT